MKKKILIAIGIIIAILLLTNPTPSDFQSCYGKSPYLRKKENLLLFSIYTNGNKSYLGIVKNFFCLDDGKNHNELKDVEVTKDTTSLPPAALDLSPIEK
jgi:hypothetical protein